MTNSNNQAQLEMQLIQYLYGDMDESQQAMFEQELAANLELRDLLEQEQRFNSALPSMSQPLIDDERIQGNRWLLRQNLQKAARPSFSLRQWWQSLWERPLTVAFQGAAMAMTFVLGVMVSGSPAAPELAPGMLAATADSPLALVNDDDYEIYQLQVNSYDATTGDIDLTFALASETRVTGNVSDQNVNQLMAVALQNDIDSASRLDTINALQPVVSGDQVYEALIYVLTNDQNPGVRYQAVQSLVSLANEERVRDALRYALREDVNPGVRVEAFNALSNFRDAQTLAVFREQMDEDSNEYIRTEARSIIEAMEGADNNNDVI